MNNSAWDDFWSAAPADTGCGIGGNRWHQIEAAQAPLWQAFARDLPKGARVLDLATGNGVVMGYLISARRDVKPLGVDLADRIPQPPKGCRSRGGIAMEALPFADESQDAVVSRFGVEYGVVPKVIAEIGRVLRHGGRAGLMTHRLDGPILAYNQPRRQGLQWAMFDANLLGKARAALQLRRAGLGIPPPLKAAPADAAARFGAGSAAWEFSEAVLQTLRLGWRDSDDAVLDVLATLQAKAENEIDRINSLERACQAAADADILESSFARNRLQIESKVAVREADRAQPPFADMWVLRKSSGCTE